MSKNEGSLMKTSAYKSQYIYQTQLSIPTSETTTRKKKKKIKKETELRVGVPIMDQWK